MAQVLDNVKWPDEMPWSAEDFQRYDESSDGIFYSQPRFVTHIDDGAIGALTECVSGLQLPRRRAIIRYCSSVRKSYGSTRCHRFYSSQLPPAGSQDAAVLDLCSRYAVLVHDQMLRHSRARLSGTLYHMCAHRFDMKCSYVQLD